MLLAACRDEASHAPPPSPPSAPAAAPVVAAPVAHAAAPAAHAAATVAPSEAFSAASPALRAAMQSLGAALRDGDVDAVTRAFSKTQTWNALNTSTRGQPVIRISYERLDRALREPGEAHDSLLGDATKSLRTYFSGQHADAWRALNPLQFAPNTVPSGQVWIAWREEDTRWVVDTLAWPLQAN